MFPHGKWTNYWLDLCVNKKKKSVWGELEREKEENSGDFYECHQQRGCKLKRGNYGAQQ